MPQSVDKDGAVRGPAPQGYSNVTTIGGLTDPSRQSSASDGCSNASKSAPHQDNNLQSGNVISLEIDERHTLRSELNEASRELVEARSFHDQSEKRLDRACANLLVAGERIPALDQSSFTMMQEAYLNASTAAIVGAEKIMIVQEQISRLELQLSDLMAGFAGSGDMSRAA